ncbi:MAG: SH3 domain-containing protein [Fibrobacteria bacterium]|nr:SH3 domain-containing protein [Fibrobacteria bacterium]
MKNQIFILLILCSIMRSHSSFTVFTKNEGLNVSVVKKVVTALDHVYASCENNKFFVYTNKNNKWKDITHILNPKNQKLVSWAGDKNGLLMAYPKQVYLFQNTTISTSTVVNVPSAIVSVYGESSMIISKNGEVLTISKSGKSSSITTIPLQEESPVVLLQSYNKLFIATTKGKVFQYDRSSKNLSSSVLVPGKIKCGLLLGTDIWFGTDKGLFTYNIKNERVSKLPIQEEMGDIIAENMTSCGSYIYLATYSGVYQYSTNAEAWRIYNLGNAFPEEFINDITINGQSAFAASDGSGVIAIPFTWPAIAIDYIRTNKSKIEVYGSVHSKNMVYYRLELGPNVNPFISFDNISQEELKPKKGLLGYIPINDLEAGSYLVNLSSKDKTDQINSQKIVFNMDALPPSILLDSISQQGNTYLVTGFYKGNAIKEVIIDPGNYKATLNVKRNSFFAEIPSSHFKGKITALIRNEFGDTASAIKEMQLDNQPPRIHMTTNNPYTNVSNYTVKGTYEEDALESITIRPGGARALINEAQHSFTFSLIVNPGINKFNITARDLSGNLAEIQISVTGDFTPPVIQLNPFPAFISSDKIVLSGLIDENYPDSLFSTPRATQTDIKDKRFSLTIPLKQGDNSIRVIAKDKSGNQAEIPVNIIRDNDAPKLLVNKIPSQTQNMTLELSGHYEESDLASISLFPGYIPAKIDFNKKTFSGNVVLFSGNNTIKITAVDKAGNTDTLLRTCNYQMDITRMKEMVSDKLDKELKQTITSLKSDNERLKEALTKTNSTGTDCVSEDKLTSIESPGNTVPGNFVQKAILDSLKRVLADLESENVELKAIMSSSNNKAEDELESVEQQQVTNENMWIGVSAARLRMTPSVKAQKQGTMTFAEEVKTFQHAGDWFFVKSNDGREGYIHQSLLINKKNIGPLTKRVLSGKNDKKISDVLVAEGAIIYNSPGIKKKQKDRIGKPTKAIVVAIFKTMAKIKYGNGKSGWVIGGYLEQQR